MSSIDDRLRAQAVPMTPAPDTEVEPESTGVTVATSKPKAGGLAWELLQTVVLTLAIFLGVRSVVQNFRVEGTSMEPSFVGGQTLVVNRAAYFHVEHTPLANLAPTTPQGSARFLFGGGDRAEDQEGVRERARRTIVPRSKLDAIRIRSSRAIVCPQQIVGGSDPFKRRMASRPLGTRGRT